jgi:hypothetical protein
LELFITQSEFPAINIEIEKLLLPEKTGIKSSDELLSMHAAVINYLNEVCDQFHFPRPFARLLLTYFRGGDMERAFKDFLPYDVRVYPLAEVAQTGKGIFKASKYGREISLVTFSRQTTEERKLALKELAEAQQLTLPPELTKQKRRSTLEKSLAIETESKTRSRKHVEEKIKPHSYLDLAQKQYGASAAKKWEKGSPESVDRRDIRKSSADIAQKVLGSKKKGGAARQRLSRLNKKRKGISKNL